MNVDEKTKTLTGEDGKLVDLVTAALTDPNLHTDVRMRLTHELTELLRTTHEDVYGPTGREAHERQLAAQDHELLRVLEAVLVDPNLRTDLRMRLHREIPELLRHAHEPDAARTEHTQ
jgi:hypothetical protein